MAFDNVRLPVDVEKGCEGGPRFKTTIVTLSSGGEQRNVEWSRERFDGDLRYGVSKKADLQGVIDFFYARQGRARGFRFKDWGDFKVTNSPIGTGTGALTTFQLVKRYTSGAINFDRKITRVVAGTLSLKVNGVATPTGWTVNNDTGLVTFDVAPAAAAAITASFQFDIPVRFDTDNLVVISETEDAIEIGSLPIVGIKE